MNLVSQKHGQILFQGGLPCRNLLRLSGTATGNPDLTRVDSRTLHTADHTHKMSSTSVESLDSRECEHHMTRLFCEVTDPTGSKREWRAMKVQSGQWSARFQQPRVLVTMLGTDAFEAGQVDDSSQRRGRDRKDCAVEVKRGGYLEVKM